MSEYDERLCEQKHRQIDEKFKEHGGTLKEYDGRIGRIEQNERESKTQIQNLCETVKSLNTTIRWFIGLQIGGYIGFFFYAAQRGLIK
jgi:chromosome segregation ATPase